MDRIEHSVEELIAQRIYALALGYEDLNDHDILRADPLLATLGRQDRSRTGTGPPPVTDQGKALAGKSTLNRLELTPCRCRHGRQRYHKIVADPAAIDHFFVEVFLQAHATPPAEIVLGSGCHR